MPPRGLVVRAMGLSPRQRAALVAAANGSTVDQTAAQTGTPPDTVKMHRTKAMHRLGASNVTHAVTLAISAGAIQLDPHGRAQ